MTRKMKKSLSERLVNWYIDVLEWWYDRDKKSRKSKPFGG